MGEADMYDSASTAATEYVVFRVAGIMCALDIAHVQEISMQFDATTVYQAPPYVFGIINLRGQIVTVIDLCRKLGLAEEGRERQKMYNVVVQSGGELIGLLVDDVDDIISMQARSVMRAPPHVGAPFRDYFAGVIELDDELIVALDVDKVTRKEERWSSDPLALIAVKTLWKKTSSDLVRRTKSGQSDALQDFVTSCFAVKEAPEVALPGNPSSQA
jgi:purine-binding chemotaxis protein CheW